MSSCAVWSPPPTILLVTPLERIYARLAAAVQQRYPRRGHAARPQRPDHLVVRLSPTVGGRAARARPALGVACSAQGREDRRNRHEEGTRAVTSAVVIESPLPPQVQELAPVTLANTSRRGRRDERARKPARAAKAAAGCQPRRKDGGAGAREPLREYLKPRRETRARTGAKRHRRAENGDSRRGSGRRRECRRGTPEQRELNSAGNLMTERQTRRCAATAGTVTR